MERVLADCVFLQFYSSFFVICNSFVIVGNNAPSYTNLTFACNTKTLGSLYSHALLILAESTKSKNKVVHEQMFKDLSSGKCPV